MKIEIWNTTNFWLNGETQKNNKFNKTSLKKKQLREWGSNWKKKTMYPKLGLKDEIKNKLFF
jgi:hypothetical protein